MRARAQAACTRIAALLHAELACDGCESSACSWRVAPLNSCPLRRACLLSQSGYVSLQDVADVQLNAGDILLLEADQGFKKRFQYNSAFGLASCCSASLAAWRL